LRLGDEALIEPGETELIASIVDDRFGDGHLSGASGLNADDSAENGISSSKSFSMAWISE
jgi:hypothetical protein